MTRSTRFRTCKIALLLCITCLAVLVWRRAAQAVASIPSAVGEKWSTRWYSESGKPVPESFTILVFPRSSEGAAATDSNGREVRVRRAMFLEAKEWRQETVLLTHSGVSLQSPLVEWTLTPPDDAGTCMRLLETEWRARAPRYSGFTVKLDTLPDASGVTYAYQVSFDGMTDRFVYEDRGSGISGVTPMQDLGSTKQGTAAANAVRTVDMLLAVGWRIVVTLALLAAAVFVARWDRD